MVLEFSKLGGNSFDKASDHPEALEKLKEAVAICKRLNAESELVKKSAAIEDEIKEANQMVDRCFASMRVWTAERS